MIYIIADVESGCPIPGKYSMISFGAIVVEEGLENCKKTNVHF